MFSGDLENENDEELKVEDGYGYELRLRNCWFLFSGSLNRKLEKKQWRKRILVGFIYAFQNYLLLFSHFLQENFIKIYLIVKL